MFAPRNVKNEPIVSKLGLVAKKVFALVLIVFFALLYLRQFIPGTDTLLHPAEIIIFILASLVFTLLFNKHPTKAKRISTSDWALLALLGIVGCALYLLSNYELGVGGMIAATILILFTIGLGLYVWNGEDKGVHFVLFARDRRYKLTTYLKHAASEWILAAIVIASVLGLLVVINITLPRDRDTVKNTSGGRDIASDILVRPTQTQVQPDPTLGDITVSPTPIDPTPSVEPTPEPTSTPPFANGGASPTPPAELPAPEEYALYVLNGSGTPGAASNIRRILEEGGLVVDYIGDASTFTYQNIQIRYNAGFEAVGAKIQQLLQPHYDNLDIAEFGPTERYRQYDVVVVHGQ